VPHSLSTELFVGTWLSGFGAMVTEVTLSDDGSFVAKYFVANSFVGKVGGRWSIEDRTLVWDFDENSGKRDARETVLDAAPGRFSLRGTGGQTTVFTRKPKRTGK
jgi:hypothetical protein